ncbi:MAG: ferredoxin family protein [Anaerolineaceae bacterium]|nr:ferredoxin family protein [Anaerolineaceae bacterium]
MMSSTEFVIRTVQPATPITYDENRCIGCNRCVEACQIDLLIPNNTKGKPPLVAYPEECWYCGCCVMECPVDAIKMHHPLMNQVRWVEKNSLLKKE